MPGPRPTEREQMSARLEHAQALNGPRQARRQVIPRLAHEAEAIGRIGDDGVDGCVGHGCEHVEAVAVVEHRPLVGVVRGRHAFASLHAGLMVVPSGSLCLVVMLRPRS